MSSSKKARIITFYSYKGGTGRSMALANIAWILASNSKRVLVVDWDLEAPGLQRYFRPFLVDRELTSSPGIVDLITAFVLEAITPLENNQKLPADWFKPLTDLDPYIISLDWKFPRGGKIDFIPAGQQGPEYALRLGSINWQKFYDVLGGGAFIEELKLRMRSGYDYDYVLVDSRTGVSDTSGICTIQMPDSLVVCFTFNNQSIEGAASITKGVFDQRLTEESRPLSPSSGGEAEGEGTTGQSYAHPYRFRVFPVPMRVDPFERDKLELRQVFARWKFDPFIERIPAAERRAYWTAVEVPYLPFFSYEEILSPFREDPTDPKSCLRAFIRIAREITQNEVEDFRSLTSPEQNYKVLQEFAKLPADFVAGAQSGDAVQRDGVKVAERAKTDITTPRTVESDIEKLIRMADQTLLSLNTEFREVAHLMWLRLVRVPAPGENTPNSKVRVKIEDLPQNSTTVANFFAAANLLTINRDVEAQETTVEVKNEELLRSWPTLNEWIKADQDLMVWRQELQSSRARWIQNNKVSTFLLTGRPLSEAKTWLETHSQYLSESEIDYIEQSIGESTRIEKRARSTVVIRIAAVLLFAVLVVGGYLLYTKNSSKTGAADEIAAKAQEKIAVVNPENSDAADQLQLAILLAVEARTMAKSDKADTLLKTALPALPKKVSDINIGRAVLGMAITADNSRLLLVTGRNSSNPNTAEDRSAQVFDTASKTIVGYMQFQQGSRLFQISPDARYVAVSSLENQSRQSNLRATSQTSSFQVTVMEPATGKVRTTIQHRGPIYDMAFSPDGRYFATASSDGRAGVVDLSDGAVGSPPFYLDYHGPLNAVTFSGDSLHLALAGEDFKVRVWTVTPGKPSWPNPSTIQMESTAFVLALSHTGDYLATISLNNSVIDLWDVQGQKKITSVDNKPTPVSTISITNDDRYLVAAGNGPLLGVWDLNGKKYEPPLRAFGNVSLMNFSADGESLSAVANNGPAAFWKYEGTFKTLAILIPQVNFTNLEIGTSNRIVTADADNVVRIWQLVPEIGTEYLTEACSRLTRNLRAEEWKQYLEPSLGAYRRTCPDLP